MANHQVPQATSALSTWLNYIEYLHKKPIDLGLERVKQVAEQLDLLTPAPYVFTVAGTNGKGTTCRTLEAILLASGLRVGVYSSPHLINYTERVRIQGDELSEVEHCRAFAAVEEGRAEKSITYFEFGTLAALYLFKAAKLDVVILEVGLGGAQDATNIVDADVAVITSIALDHTDWLGNTRESIGREKAGILRSGKPAIIGEPDVPQTIFALADEKNTPLYCVNQAWGFSAQEQRWSWWCGDLRLDNLPLPNVPLANAASALAALAFSALEVSEQAIFLGLQQAALPGRFQVLQYEPMLIVDVAHNPHAAAYLASRLASQLSDQRKVHAVVGMLIDKDIAGTLDYLRPLVDFWYCASLDGPRAASAQELAEHLADDKKVEMFANVEAAWHKAMQAAQQQDIVIVFGSFLTVAAVIVAHTK